MATAALPPPRSIPHEPGGPGRAGRLLGLAGGQTPAPTALHAFGLLACVHLATERAGNALVVAASPGIPAPWVAFAVALVLVAAAALVLALRPAGLRRAAFLGFGAQLAFVLAAFPRNANHDLILLLVLALLCAFDFRRPAEREVLVACARWLAVIVLFWTGAQKLLYGTYFQGDYLAVRIAHSDTFAALFQYLLPDAEFLRLRGLGHDPGTTGLALFGGRRAGPLPAPGAGPYRVAWPPFLLVSNAVWIFEVCAPWLLLWRRTRRAAALATIGFLALIELGAREYFFGLLFTGLLLLFLPGRWLVRCLPVFAVAYLGLLLRRLAILEGWIGP